MTGIADFVFKPGSFPAKPGCYLMKDSEGQILYIGKASNLRSRLSSYFQASATDYKSKTVQRNVSSIEVILTSGSYEALVLENNLIKEYKPSLNRVLMKEDSGYYYLQLTGERLPRFVRFRKNRYVKAVEGLREVQGHKRFGPYLSSAYREAILDFVTDHFGIRICKVPGSRPCLRWHLGKCSAPCGGHISRETYSKRVMEATDLLEARQTHILKRMELAMVTLSANMEFERAQLVKDQMETLRKAVQYQVVERELDYDQLLIFTGGGDGYTLVAYIPMGVLTSMRLVPKSNDIYRVIQGFSEKGETPEIITDSPRNLKHLLPTGLKSRLPHDRDEKALMRLCAKNKEQRMLMMQEEREIQPGVAKQASILGI